MGALSVFFSDLSDETLVNALAAEDWQHPSGAKGHLVRELIYDEIPRRHVVTAKAIAAVMLGLFREPYSSHAFSACYDCLEKISGAPADVAGGLLEQTLFEQFGVGIGRDRVDMSLPLLVHCAAVLSNKDSAT